jgi:hypothetical protein
MFYRPILKQSFRLTLQNKILWFIGFFVALLGNGGEYNIMLTAWDKLRNFDISIKEWSTLATSSPIIAKFLTHLQNLFLTPLSGQSFDLEGYLMSFGVVILIIGLIYLVITSQGVLISSLDKLTRGRIFLNKKWLREEWVATRGKFWELFCTNIIFKVMGLFIAFVISLPFFILISRFAHLPILTSLLAVSFFILTPIMIVVSFLIKYSLMFIIIKDKDPLSAFIAGVQLFKDNWLITTENALVLLVFNLAFALGVFVTALVLSFPFIAVVALWVYPLALPEGYYYSIIAWVTIFVGAGLGSVLAVFQYSVWVSLFNKLNSRTKVYSKVARLSADLLGKFVPTSFSI